MSHSISCPCGARLKVRPEHFGKRVKCVKCGLPVFVTPPTDPSDNDSFGNAPPPVSVIPKPQPTPPVAIGTERDQSVKETASSTSRVKKADEQWAWGRLTVAGWSVTLASILFAGVVLLLTDPFKAGEKRDEGRLKVMIVTVSGFVFFHLAKWIAKKMDLLLLVPRDIVTLHDVESLFEKPIPPVVTAPQSDRELLIRPNSSPGISSDVQTEIQRQRSKIERRKTLAKIFLGISAVTFSIAIWMMMTGFQFIFDRRTANDASAVFFAVGIVSVIPGILMLGDKSSLGWQLAFQEKGASIGLPYSREVNPKILGLMENFQSFSHRVSQGAANCLMGKIDC